MIQEFLRARWADLKHGSRSYSRSRGVAAVSVLSLGLGIGVATTVATIVDAVLFRTSTGLSEPDRVVRVYTSTSDGKRYGRSSYADFARLSAGLRSVNGIAAGRWEPLPLGRSAQQRLVMTERVTPAYFRVLGVEPVMGRTFTAEDEAAGDDRIAVVSHRFWARELQSAPGATGRTIDLGGRETVVIGVAPPELDTGHPLRSTDVWLPLFETSLDASGERHERRLGLVARLEEGAGVEDLSAELRVMASRLHREYPREHSNARGDALELSALPERESRLTPDRRAAFAILALFPSVVAALVLLIACANVATLFVARASERAHETALRLALGASRGRLTAMFFAESLLPALAAAGVGVSLAWAMMRALSAMPTSSILPLQVAFELDAGIVAFAVMLAASTTLLFGVAPSLAGVTAGGGRLFAAFDGSGGAPRRVRLRRTLVVVQMACSMTLVAGAGLFYRGVHDAATLELGFDPAGIALTTKALDWSADPAASASRSWLERTLARVRARPDVAAAHASSAVEASLASAEETVVTPSSGDDAALPELTAFRNQVTPGYLEMLGITVVRGRALELTDRAGNERVAVVNDVLARRLWPNRDPIGRRFQSRGDEVYTVVGEARDGKFRDFDDPPAPYFWTSLDQGSAERVAIVIEGRTSADAMVDVLRREIERGDVEVPAIPPRTLASMVDLQLAFGRLAMRILGWGGAFGLLLAGVGVYGIVSLSVSARHRELGIRVAVGAQKAQILRLVLGEGVAIALVGGAVGLALTVPLAQLLRAQLLGTSPVDPSTLGAAAALIVAVAVAASFEPAKRAATIDPVTAIREQ